MYALQNERGTFEARRTARTTPAVRSLRAVVAVNAAPARAALAALVVATALAPAVAPVAAADPGITVGYDGEAVTVANGTSQVVTGTADVPVGTELNVRVRSTGDTQPRFIKTTSAVVTENGTWAAAFDFSRQSPDGTFSLTVLTENGTLSTEVEGEIVACGGDCAETPPSGTPTPIPEQTPTPTETAQATAPVAFGENIFVVDAGGVAAIPLTFDERDEAVVVLGNETKSNYELEALVRDEDGDGQAVLYVDTSLAGRGGETLSTSGGDSVQVRSETSLDSMLDPATYDVSLYAGGERTAQPADVGSLVVQAADTPTTTAADTADASHATQTPGATGTTGTGFGSIAMGAIVSGAFLVSGAVLAAVLLKR